MSNEKKVEHRFGGDWTQEKLERIAKYLPAYTKIFHANERAQFLNTMYVDAFAGTGYRSSERRTRKKQDNGSNLRLLETAVVERDSFKKGSAVIALDVEPPFDQYLFIEKKQSHADALLNLRDTYPQRANQMSVVCGDANRALTELCSNTDWRRWRAVMFLDPYGMQIDWSVIESIARTKAIDLWLLFPLAQAVNRLITKQPPPEKWAKALTRAFGTDEWLERFYAPPKIGGLFDDLTLSDLDLGDVVVKNTSFSLIADFFVERLRTVFPEVAPNPLALESSTNIPLYLLCFAAHNKTAVKIASHVLGK